jgi:hypothetical protein
MPASRVLMIKKETQNISRACVEVRGLTFANESSGAKVANPRSSKNEL